MIRRYVMLLVPLLATSSARADVSADQAAQATKLFERGRTFIAQNKVDAACTAFADSLHLDPQIGTRLNLADCRERQGRLAEAYELFNAAAKEAAETGKSGRETFARDRASALANKLVLVAFRVTEPAPDLVVKLGGMSLTAAQLKAERAVLPGKISVDVAATGKKPIHIERTVTAGTAIVIDIPALSGVETQPPAPREPTNFTESKPTETKPTGSEPTNSKSHAPATNEPTTHSAVAPTAPIAVAPALPPQPEPAPDPVDERAPSRRVPIIIASTGGVLVLASMGVGLHAKSRYDTAAGLHDVNAVSSAQREADIGSGIAIVGAIGIAVGAVLYLRTPSHGLVVAPAADGSSASITLAGAF